MRPRNVRAFTLVELMVVIGIIALLIAMLMPALVRSRQQAQTTECLSNLRQIGLGFQMYSNDNHGSIVPFQLYDAGISTPLHDNWATILVDGKYIAAPDETSSNANLSYGNSVLRCPSGVNQKWTTITPEYVGAQFSAVGAEFWRVASTLSGKTYDCWYGANAASDTTAYDGAPLYTHFPMSPSPIPGTQIYRQVKFTQIHHSEDMVLIYDGIGTHWGYGWGYTQINGRHNNGKDTNLLFADGHVQTYPRTQLPSSYDEMKLLATLNAANPYPHWRLDQ
jgi:prepilin-type processing-associated H-X9-DG protein/prepilin-type N-terminal cleavage/methylation domain-containing protein